MRYLIILGFLLFSTNAFAGNIGIGGGNKDAVWRSTSVSHALSFVPLSSSTMRNIQLYAIIVESPTVNTDSWVTIYNSTTGVSGSYNPNRTTATYTPTVSKSLLEMSPGDTFIYNIKLSSGMVINKVGTANVNILWDFIDSREVNYIPYRP